MTYRSIRKTWISMPLLALAVLFIFGSCSAPVSREQATGPQVTFDVDISHPLDDLFHVTVRTANLGTGNGIYNLAATAPGTYSILDFGRFVQSFRAFDSRGNEIPVEHVSTDKWKISRPEQLALLKYDIEDSFDANVKDNPVAPMCGSGIDSNYAAFNTFSVLGYFDGLQENPVRMKIEYKPGWTIATAMDVDRDGYYVADTFDRLADSPVLIGTLTAAETKVNDMSVGVYVYSVDTSLSAQKILSLADDVLQSGGAFARYSPAPYYKFLFVLLDGPTFQRYGLRSAGALEHSYSSIYVLPMTLEGLKELRSTMAHEFMHILTPLNLHSEIIQSFNFALPTPSEHIWLYEGVTEWESDIMQLRYGLMTPEEFLSQLTAKLNVNDNFDKDMSLTEMAKTVYTEKGNNQFVNVYNRGAATAAMLDIRLLELSHGTKGLREVLLQLLNEYGKKRPFPEKEFFTILTRETYPEIGGFIRDYIEGTKPLPVEEYMAKVGFRYIAQKPADGNQPMMGLVLNVNEDRQIYIRSVDDSAQQFGFRNGDVLLKLFGAEMNLGNARQMIGKTGTMKVGDSYEVVVRRDGKEVTLQGRLLQRMVKHAFEDSKTLTPEQKFLREHWMKNLS